MKNFIKLYLNEKPTKCEFCEELKKLGACNLVFCEYRTKCKSVKKNK